MVRIRYRSSKILPVRTHSRQSRSTRSRSSGWTDSSQPNPVYSCSDCPVIQRHSGESSFIAPSGAATQTTWAPPWTSERYRSSLRLISAAAASAASVLSPATLSMISPAPNTFPAASCTGNQEAQPHRSSARAEAAGPPAAGDITG